eukprot:4026811-Amphidinium_carterae.1
MYSATMYCSDFRTISCQGTHGEIAQCCSAAVSSIRHPCFVVIQLVIIVGGGIVVAEVNVKLKGAQKFAVRAKD